jgi:protein TonB
MIVIISIIALVAAVSLYDYYGAKSWQLVTSSIRNNTVFEHRNKEYGAYVIRRDYDRNLLLIIFSLFLGLGLVYAGFVSFQAMPAKLEFHPPVPTGGGGEIEIIIPEPPIDVVVAPTSGPVSDFVEPTVIDKPIIEPVKPIIPEGGGDPGPGAGTDPFGGSGPGGPGGPGPITIVVPPVVIPPAEPTDYPDVEAKYPGGYPEMSKFIGDHIRFPEIAKEVGGGKVYLRFVVNEEGQISSVKVTRGVADCAECDKEAMRVIKSMPNWIPGKVKGKPVSSYFDLPINFEVQ